MCQRPATHQLQLLPHALGVTSTAAGPTVAASTRGVAGVAITLDAVVALLATHPPQCSMSARLGGNPVKQTGWRLHLRRLTRCTRRSLLPLPGGSGRSGLQECKRDWREKSTQQAPNNATGPQPTPRAPCPTKSPPPSSSASWLPPWSLARLPLTVVAVARRRRDLPDFLRLDVDLALLNDCGIVA